MSDRPTRLTTPIDFEAEGKQCDFIRLPHSVHRSAYGWLPLPVVSIKNGDGPTVLLMSGTHGDEYEGQVVLCPAGSRAGARPDHGPRDHPADGQLSGCEGGPAPPRPSMNSISPASIQAIRTARQRG